MAEAPEDQAAAERLLQEVAEVARRLAEAGDLDELLQRIVRSGEDYVDDCDGVSLMLVRRGGKISSPAYSSTVALESDRAQYEANEGPCIDSIREHETFRVDDLQADERWPNYREEARGIGVRAVMSFRLFLLEDTMGALNFYSRTPVAFGTHGQAIGQVFASLAAVALKAAIAESSLEAALASRDVIGQAKGVLMSQEQLTPDAAFDRLREASQHQNRPLREIAEEVAQIGKLP